MVFLKTSRFQNSEPVLQMTIRTASVDERHAIEGKRIIRLGGVLQGPGGIRRPADDARRYPFSERTERP